MQDSIKREIAIAAPKEKVYAAITDPRQIVRWFPDTVEGTLEVGDRPVLRFDECGQNQIYVEAAQPHEYFAYRWVPGGQHFMGDVLTVTNTLVEFRISEADGVSTVSLTESGFAALPAELAAASLQQNSGGWDYMIGRLQALFALEMAR